jgi:hypothetical protein
MVSPPPRLSPQLLPASHLHVREPLCETSFTQTRLAPVPQCEPVVGHLQAYLSHADEIPDFVSLCIGEMGTMAVSQSLSTQRCSRNTHKGRKEQL